MKTAFYLVLLFSLSIHATYDCQSQQNDKIRKIHKIGESLDQSNDIPPDLAAILHGISVENDMSAEELECLRGRLRILDFSLNKTDESIKSLEESMMSWHGTSQVRELFAHCQNVNKAHRLFQQSFKAGNHYRIAWLELKRTCAANSPNTALGMLINRMSGTEISGHMNLGRDALIRSKYDIAKYRQFADYVMDEAKRCAILAITCLSATYNNATAQELAVFDRENNEHLQLIQENLEQGHRSIKEEFFEKRLSTDLREQLDWSQRENFDIYEETDWVFKNLSKKYEFRGWAVIRFDGTNEWPADRAFWGSYNQYKAMINFRNRPELRSSLIVHAAMRHLRNCSNFRDVLHSKTLSQHLSNVQFKKLQSNQGNLGSSIDVLKEWLINLPEAPDRLFVLVVRHTPFISVNYNPDYHYTEIVRDENGRRSKHVLVGFC